MQSLVKWAVKKTLGEYFELDVDAMGLDSWAGEATLLDLKLRTDAAERALGTFLPAARCTGGHVARAVAIIPWKKLALGDFSQPCVVRLVDMQMRFEGLAGTEPHFVSASVLALGRLMFQFSGQLEPGTVSRLLETIVLLLRNKSREVLKSVLGFVKVVIPLPLSSPSPGSEHDAQQGC